MSNECLSDVYKITQHAKYLFFFQCEHANDSNAQVTSVIHLFLNLLLHFVCLKVNRDQESASFSLAKT